MSSWNGLTDKQKVFIEKYLECWNASEAARQAGYKNPQYSGYENLTKPYIQERIQQRLLGFIMDADEAMSRLSEQGRSDMAVFLDCIGEGGQLDLTKVKKSGKAHLIKSISWTRYGPRLELYDAQRALELVLKVHGRFKETVDHTGAIVVHHTGNVKPEDF
jgi:phage terminase small subunit